MTFAHSFRRRLRAFAFIAAAALAAARSAGAAPAASAAWSGSVTVSPSQPVSGPMGVGDDGLARIAWRDGSRLAFALVSHTGARHSVTVGSTAHTNNAAATAPLATHGTAIVWRSRRGPMLASLSASGKVLHAARLEGEIDDDDTAGSPVAATPDGGALGCSSKRSAVVLTAVSASGRQFSTGSVAAPGFVNSQSCAVFTAGAQVVIAWLEQTADERTQLEVVRVADGGQPAAPTAVLPAGQNVPDQRYSLAVTASGAVAVAWSPATGADTTTMQLRWLEADDTLSPVQSLAARRKGVDSGPPGLGAVARDAVMAVYTAADHKLQARTSSAGSGLGSAKILARDGSTGTIAATDGHAVVAWTPGDFDTKLTATTWQNGRWATPKTLARCVARTQQPCPELNSVAISHNGHAAISWSSFTQQAPRKLRSFVAFG